MSVSVEEGVDEHERSDVPPPPPLPSPVLSSSKLHSDDRMRISGDAQASADLRFHQRLVVDEHEDGVDVGVDVAV